MVQKGAENSRNLTKVIKSARFFARICRNLPNLYFNILLDWVVWGILLLNFVLFLVEEAPAGIRESKLAGIFRDYS